MRYFYDTEFLENGAGIDLISIGIVTEDGSREYYAVNADMPLERIKSHHWLMQNVWPHLPLRDIHPQMNEPPGPFRNDVPMAGRCKCKPQDGLLDTRSTLVKPKWVIANEVRDFLLRPNELMELWAYYGAYDHVVMSWLWGPMANRPAGIPMFSHDIMQFASTLSMDGANLPQQTSQLHNALDDARWTRDAWRYLTGAAECLAGRES